MAQVPRLLPSRIFLQVQLSTVRWSQIRRRMPPAMGLLAAGCALAAWWLTLSRGESAAKSVVEPAGGETSALAPEGLPDIPCPRYDQPVATRTAPAHRSRGRSLCRGRSIDLDAALDEPACDLGAIPEAERTPPAHEGDVVVRVKGPRRARSGQRIPFDVTLHNTGPDTAVLYIRHIDTIDGVCIDASLPDQHACAPDLPRGCSTSAIHTQTRDAAGNRFGHGPPYGGVPSSGQCPGPWPVVCGYDFPGRSVSRILLAPGGVARGRVYWAADEAYDREVSPATETAMSVCEVAYRPLRPGDYQVEVIVPLHGSESPQLSGRREVDVIDPSRPFR
jgi:hypothetical protein